MAHLADFGHDTQRLDGQVALVTGGSRGLGRAFARALAAAGATVAVAARSAAGVRESARQIQEQGGQAAAYALDVTDPAAVEQVVAAIGRDLGPIDLLVNNAGVMAPVGPDWLVNRAEWWQTFEINVLGAFLCAQVVLPGMIARGQGRIINISSGAVNWASGYASAYHASKAAVTNWSENLAQTTQAHGVSVFAYAPGFVRSDMTEYLAYSPAVQQWFGDFFQKIFDEGHDTPLELTVAVFMLLACGQADALSGRHIADTDVPEQLLRNIAQIRQDHLYVLRLNSLPSREQQDVDMGTNPMPPS
jgi:NAD(P)-dependent dehydrogenase (short-subunit alcohol dehydrogenase family)